MRILLIEDSDDDATLFMRAASFEVVWKDSLSAALQMLDSEAFDAVVLDPGLPNSRSPVEAWRAIRRAANNLPVVALSGCWNESLARELAKEGTAFVLKSATGHDLQLLIEANVEKFHALRRINERRG